MPNGITLSYPLIALSVFARQLCLPVPALFLLIAAGAVARQGQLSVSLIVAMSVAGCLGGDLVWFEAGRRWGRRILRVFTGLADDPRRSSERAHAIFERWGLQSLLVTKFIPGLDGITPPLAGLEGATRLRFVLYDGIGSLLWSALYVLCGYLFSKQVDKVLEVAADSGRILAWVVLAPFAAFVLWRAITIFRMVRRLRMKRISPLHLHARLASGEPIVVIDLLNFQQDAVNQPGIEGAVRIDPARLRSRAQIRVPKGLSIILYCSSSDQFRSARVALALRRKGVSEVWVLEGGLAGWTAEDLPVATDLLTEAQVIRKFGLEMYDRNAGRVHDSTTPTLQVEEPQEHA